MGTVIDRCEAQARQPLHRAWAQILRDRDRDGHGLAGDVAPPFADTRQGDEPDSRIETQPMFDGIVEPRVWLGAVRAARSVLDGHDVDATRRWWTP
ncbi:MAG: hypothetical protein ACRDRP_22230 [Pseudonocardiaceae bacterium]